MTYWIQYRAAKGVPLGKRENVHTDKINNARSKAVMKIGYTPDVTGAIYLNKDSRYPVGFVFYDDRFDVHVWSDYRTRGAYFVNSEGIISKIGE